MVIDGKEVRCFDIGVNEEGFVWVFLFEGPELCPFCWGAVKVIGGGYADDLFHRSYSLLGLRDYLVL